MESIHGCHKTIEYERLAVCSSCKGKKGRIGYSPVECKSCKGTGLKYHKSGLFKIEVVCEDCLGEGSVYKNPCV
jgi:molecular chaperone DnaJ